MFASLSGLQSRNFLRGNETRFGRFASIDQGGMPLRFPRRSYLWSTTIDAYSLDSRPDEDDLPCDAASVRRRSIAAILLRG